MKNLTKNLKDRPYSRWARNVTIANATSIGLKNGDGPFDGEHVLKVRDKQEAAFNSKTKSWKKNQL